MRPITMSADGTTMQHGDEKLIVRFYLKEVLNEKRTREDGINKYDDVEFMEITIPGCRDNVDRPASDQDKLRFRRQYEIFVSSKREGESGTPLSQFPFISPAERKELEYFNIYTGESILNLQDVHIDKIPIDIRGLAKKVQAFIDVAKDSAVSVKYAEENESLRNEISLIQEQMKHLLMNAERDRLNGDRKTEFSSSFADKGSQDIQGEANEFTKRGRRKGRNAEVGTNAE